jgi:TolB-like protein
VNRAGKAHAPPGRYGQRVPAVRVQLLGGFSLADGAGREVALPTRKAQALLARLARRPGAPLARAHLAALLWPDRPDAQGRGSLRQALASVRRALAARGAEGPAAQGDAVMLPRDAADVDVAELEAALAAGDVGRALALHRGPLLDGFPPVVDLFDEWVHAERTQLLARVLDAVRPALEDGGAAAAPDGGARTLELAARALSLDPAFEPAYRARMRVLAARGDRAGALREYARCREALSRTVGAAPSAGTEALRAELEAGRTASAPDRRGPSLAVLPFEVRSEDPAARTFAEGLAEEIAYELSRFRPLELVAMESAARPELAGLEPSAIGDALGAAYLLCGGVRAAGGRLRVAARLVEAPSGRQVWADRHEADVADVFGVQDRIAQAVASALALGIDERELEHARARPPDRLDAYACCLRGMVRLRGGDAAADREARGLFLRALELSPGCARAHAGLSLSHFNDWSCAAWERWDENEREAFRHASEAVRLDPRDHLAHYILGRVLLYRREFERATHHLDRALALNPNDADALVQLALGRTYLGDAAQGLALAAAARRLHPFHPPFYRIAEGMARFFAREPAEAVALLERDPDAYVDTRAFLAAARAHLGDAAGARAERERFLARFQRSIAPGARPEDAVAWVLRVNPLRRAEDRAWVTEGLARAGVGAPPVALDAPPA